MCIKVRGVASAFSVWVRRWRATLEYFANASTDELLALRDAAQSKLEAELQQVCMYVYMHVCVYVYAAG